MASVGNWVGEHTTTVGNSTVIDLGGPLPGFTSFDSISETEFWYAIIDGDNREAGKGVYSSNTFSRDTVYSILENGIYDGNSPGRISLSGTASIYSTFNKTAFDEFTDHIDNLDIHFEDAPSDNYIHGRRNKLWEPISPNDAAYKLEWDSLYYSGKPSFLNTVVLDSGWLMVANKYTEDPAAPQTVGQSEFAYKGTMLETNQLAAQITFGNRYTINDTGYLGGYRVYAITGNVYRVFLVEDPEGIPKLTELALFTAQTTGWQTFIVTPVFVTPGVTFDLVASVQEPNPTPTVVFANYNYETPQNPGLFGAGDIQHARSRPDVMSISYIDHDANDRTALIQGLGIGDVIEGAGQRWAVQANEDQADHALVAVTPALVGSPTGVQQFAFETTTPTPITYAYDPNYWGLNPPSSGSVEGLLGVDIAYSDITPDTTAYGTDIIVQLAIVSDDWDFMAQSGSSGGGTAQSKLTTQEIEWVQANSEFFQVGDLMTSDNTWTSMGSVTIPVDEGFMVSAAITGHRTDGFGIYHAEYRATAWNDSGAVTAATTVQHEAGTNPALDVRLEVVGSTVEFQVRGAIGEDWQWRGILFDRRIE